MRRRARHADLDDIVARLRRLKEEAAAKRREADEIFARVDARRDARRRAEEARLERRRSLLRRLNPFRRAA